MGFLHKLWDETLAGPTPDAGLGKLRKYNSFNAARSGSAGFDGGSSMGDHQGAVPISRSITILRSNSTSARNVNVASGSGSGSGSGSIPSSPAGSSTPTSPFSPTTPRENFKKLARRKSVATEPRSPKGYDWIVLSALDR